MQSQHYGLGMGVAPPLLQGQGPSLPKISTQERPVDIPPTPTAEFTLPKITTQSTSMGGGGGGGSNYGPVGMNEPVGFSLN
jgi:hypothetical protein